MEMKGRLFWLSDAAWDAIEPDLPHGQAGKPRVDDRRVISGILHVLKTGCRWRDVPAEYGPPTTIYNRYHRWAGRRIWQQLFERMAGAGPIPPELSIDSTHVKAHRSAQGQKGGMGASDWRLAWRKNEQDPLPGRSSRATGCIRANARQCRRYLHGHSPAGG